MMNRDTDTQKKIILLIMNHPLWALGSVLILLVLTTELFRRSAASCLTITLFHFVVPIVSIILSIQILRKWWKSEYRSITNNDFSNKGLLRELGFHFCIFVFTGYISRVMLNLNFITINNIHFEEIIEVIFRPLSTVLLLIIFGLRFIGILLSPYIRNYKWWYAFIIILATFTLMILIGFIQLEHWTGISLLVVIISLLASDGWAFFKLRAKEQVKVIEKNKSKPMKLLLPILTLSFYISMIATSYSATAIRLSEVLSPGKLTFGNLFEVFVAHLQEFLTLAYWRMWITLVSLVIIVVIVMLFRHIYANHVNHKVMIRPIKKIELQDCLQIFRKGYETVALELGLTDENCPDRGRASLTLEKLVIQFESGAMMYGFFTNDNLVGFLGMKKLENGDFEIDDIIVLPEHRHNGYGKELLDFSKQRAKELGASKIKLSMIDGNKRLKKWYESNGFITVSYEQYENAPYKVGSMECTL